MEWSDIRIFLQVTREGSMAAATIVLGLDHSTISRRIARLEEKTGVNLFVRAGRRLMLTAEGEKVVQAAEKLETIIIRDVMSLSEDPQRLSGQVRIGATEEFGAHYLAWRLAELTQSHPGIEIELIAQPRTFSLAARDVDVLVTLERPQTGDIRFKRLIDFHLGVYSSASYFHGRKRPVNLEELGSETWCGDIRELLTNSDIDLRAGTPNDFASKFRTASVSVQLAAVLSGSALAAIPCFVAMAHPALERILPEDAVFERAYWLAVHQDMAKHPRVRAVMDAIEAQVFRDRALFVPPVKIPHWAPDYPICPLH